MAYQFKLQVPISRELNKKLKAKVAKAGLSSVNDIVRLLLTDYANGNLVLSFMNNTVESEPEPFIHYDTVELSKIVAQAMQEHKEGKTKPLDCSKDIHKQLMED